MNVTQAEGIAMADYMRRVAAYIEGTYSDITDALFMQKEFESYDCADVINAPKDGYAYGVSFTNEGMDFFIFSEQYHTDPKGKGAALLRADIKRVCADLKNTADNLTIDIFSEHRQPSTDYFTFYNREREGVLSVFGLCVPFESVSGFSIANAIYDTENNFPVLMRFRIP